MSESQLELFSLDEHLAKLDGRAPRKLHPSERDSLLTALRHEPWLTVQANILQNINGRLFRLSSIDLSKEQALIAMAKEQGIIQGLRLFFDIVEDLIQTAEDGGNNAN